MSLNLEMGKTAAVGAIGLMLLLVGIAWFAAPAPASTDVVATTSALQPKKNCRPPQPQPPFNDLKVLRVSCAKGRSIARRYLNGGFHPYGGTIQHFKCNERRTSYEGYRVYCHRRNKVVKFEFGF